MSAKRKVILYIACSLDGYITAPGDNLDFLDMVDSEGEDYGYFRFYKTVDTIIMGRRTFDWVTRVISGLPHPDKKTFIITRTERPAIGKTSFYTGPLKELVESLKHKKGRNIYCDGGAEIVNELLKHNLIDEIILSIIPVILGDGISLFNSDNKQKKLKLKNSQSYSSGLVQVHYEVLK